MVREKLIFKYLGTELDSCPVEALAFISAHQIATGLAMSSIQKLAMCGFVDRLKGNITINGTNFLTSLISRGAVLYPLCPTDDSTASAAGYSIDLISATSKGTYVNMIPSDFTPNGVKGSATKYFDMGASSSDYPLSSNSFGVYCRDSIAESIISIGVRQTSNTGRSFVNTRNASDLAFANNNNFNNTFAFAETNGEGLFYSSRSDALGFDFVKNNVATNFVDAASANSAFNFIAHGFNNSGTPSGGSTKELSMYFAGLTGLSTQNQIDDWNECVQWYQTNVITGGRNV